MPKHFNWCEARTLIILAVPVFLAQLAQTSMGFVDTVVAGRVSHIDMAAVAVASSFWIPGTLFGLGLLMAITPLVAQSIGAGHTITVCLGILSFRIGNGFFLWRIPLYHQNGRH